MSQIPQSAYYTPLIGTTAHKLESSHSPRTPIDEVSGGDPEKRKNIQMA